MNILRKITKPFVIRERIKRYLIDNDYIVITRKYKYVVVKVNGKTVFNNVKTNWKFSAWFKEFKKGYSDKLRKHKINQTESLIFERKLIKNKITPKVKRVRDITLKDVLYRRKAYYN